MKRLIKLILGSTFYFLTISGLVLAESNSRSGIDSLITIFENLSENRTNSWCRQPDTSFAVRIDSRHCAFPGSNYRVPVSLKSPPYVIWGFDFLIAYDTSMLSFQWAEAGPEFFSDSGCNWQYFSYRFGHVVNCDPSPCPGGLIRVTGLADINSVPGPPDCWNPGKTADLFHLVFTAKTTDRDFYGYSPIQFYWSDCGDNQVAFKFEEDSYGQNTVLVATESRIFGRDGILKPTDTFPTFNGPADSCFSDPDSFLYYRSKRLIDFYNGGTQLICVDSIAVNGDINLNGYYYEMNDAYLFAEYFLYGDSAFRINTAGQIEATDINEDGEKLKLEDLVQLVRIALDDLRPDWTFDSTLLGNNAVRNNSGEAAVYLDNETCVDLIWLNFEGNIMPRFPNPTTFVLHHFDGTNTRVLLLGLNGFEKGSSYLFHYGGAGRIVEAQASTLEGFEVPLTINDITTDVNETEDNLPTSFALYQNYPNPFNNETIISFNLPSASEVELEIINLLGQVVFSVDRRHSAGFHTVAWNGTDNSGRVVSSGIYHYRLKAGDFVDSKKMVLLK